jgi:hypothetical protein
LQSQCFVITSSLCIASSIDDSMVMETLIQGSCCKIIMGNKNMEKKNARNSWWLRLRLWDKICFRWKKDASHI